MLPKMAFAGFAKRFQKPSLSEGFQDIVQVDFQVSLSPGRRDCRSVKIPLPLERRARVRPIGLMCADLVTSPIVRRDGRAASRLEQVLDMMRTGTIASYSSCCLRSSWDEG